MAVPNTLEVTGAGYAPANGTYTLGANYNGSAAWYKSGNSHIIFLNSGGPVKFWSISEYPAIGGGPSCNTIYSTNFAIPGPTWPGEYPGDPAADSITWSNDCLGTGNAPTVAAGAAGGLNCSDPKNRCAYAVGNESGIARYLRLRVLGYV